MNRKRTISVALDFSVLSSSFSSFTSSLNVGLRGSRNRPGVPGGLRAFGDLRAPGVFMALLSGSFGVSGTSTLVCLSWFDVM